MEVNTSFVAPAVPVSPENKLYSGNKIYMGFFKPQTQKQWLGNLKKYTLDLESNTILDSTTPVAKLATDPITGKFKADAQSFWSSAADGGTVEAGGVGEVLNGMDLATRKIYTYKATSKNLIDLSNAFIKIKYNAGGGRTRNRPCEKQTR